MEHIDFWVDIFLEIQKKNQNLGLEGKISRAFNVFTFPNFKKKSIPKMWKIKYLFTLGPMTQATLIIDWKYIHAL